MDFSYFFTLKQRYNSIVDSSLISFCLLLRLPNIKVFVFGLED